MAEYKILDQIMDSKDFTVGGGSASAMAGAMAAGLLAMVARLSIGKEYGFSDEKYSEIVNEAENLGIELLAGALADTEAYMMIKTAYALPKGTDIEKSARLEAIQAAGVKAASVPMENSLKCKHIYTLANLIKNKSNPNASSDLESAILLSRAGVIGCALNIEANLPLIKAASLREPLELAARELKEI